MACEMACDISQATAIVCNTAYCFLCNLAVINSIRCKRAIDIIMKVVNIFCLSAALTRPAQGIFCSLFGTCGLRELEDQLDAAEATINVLERKLRGM